MYYALSPNFIESEISSNLVSMVHNLASGVRSAEVAA